MIAPMRPHALGLFCVTLLLVAREGRCEPPPTQEELASEEAMEALEAEETDYPLRSKSAMIVGISLTGAGGGALFGALVLASVGGITGSDRNFTASEVMAGCGLAAVVVGVPLLVYGASDDPYAARAELRISPTSLGVHGTF